MVIETKDFVKLAEDATQELLDWAKEIEQSDATVFERAEALATKLGAHYHRQNGLTEIGFWAPELTGEIMRPRDIYLEVFTPLEEIDWRSPMQTTHFRRDCLRLKQQGEFFWGAIEGMQAGTKDRPGCFYWLRYYNQKGQLQTIRDMMPYSLPFGIFAPAELYDMESLQANREDMEYLRRTSRANGDEEVPRVGAPVAILQLHIGTASRSGTIAGLTEIYRQISRKIRENIPLTPAEECYVGYDAVQLLPIEPPIEYRQNYQQESEFFLFADKESDRKARILPPLNRSPIKLLKPNTQDWGYDVPILGSSATNPAILQSLRPDELIDFIATLHNFPTGPIQIIYDLVYGHADNQAELLINRQYLKGPNMYGQDLNHQLPTVRAIFLELQRRKINTGADGIRVDGGQDFRFFNPLSGRVEQDDAYLLAMSDLVQEINGCQRLLFTIYEDGRPWPEEGWEEKSTYRELIELKPESYQWGPLIFAHNTPTLTGFWERKWRRVCEVIQMGDRWITGCGNHDTLRRGSQVDPSKPINWRLGENLTEVIRHAYDNQAVTLWVYGFSPGLPMDFINCTTRSPWMFFRNTDDRYGVKVISEEMGFLDWQISPEFYDREWVFPRVKSLGFKTLEQLRAFGRFLEETILERNYDLLEVIQTFHSLIKNDRIDISDTDLFFMKFLDTPEIISYIRKLNVERFKKFAQMFMEDCYEVCNVSHYLEDLNPDNTEFNLKLRQFRRDRSWLNGNLKATDRFNKISEGDRTIFYGIRSNPENPTEQIAMVAHLEGEPFEITLGDWLQLDMSEWTVDLASVGLNDNNNLADLRCFNLANSQALLLKPIQKSED
ncbi:MAG: glucosylglycerol hydrolase [Prochloraceae cyanobacterium]|nr:glucosylglycerol hydrolase [Prochloraceae cyanobacterium]